MSAGLASSEASLSGYLPVSSVVFPSAHLYPNLFL